MRRRNKHFLKEKEIQRLKNEGSLIHDAIHSQGWVKLDKPYHQGYNAKWVLRKDIARREDAEDFQRALDISNKTVWSRNKDFRYKNHKTKKVEILLPGLKPISKKQYESLPPQVRKFFRRDLSSIQNWRYGFRDITYICILTYELVVLKTKTYVTHRREHDEVLYQREAEIEKRLYDLTDDHPWGNYGDGKFWRRRALRMKKTIAKHELREEINDYQVNGGYYEDYGYLLDADWNDWDEWGDWDGWDDY